MTRMKVVLAPTVQEQILVQVLHIAQDSVTNALAWEDRLRISILSIGEMAGHVIDSDATGRLGYIVRNLFLTEHI